jgi:hypothetical protein
MPEKMARALEVPLYRLFYDGEVPSKLENLRKRKRYLFVSLELTKVAWARATARPKASCWLSLRNWL